MSDKIQFEYRDIDLLVPYARNARVHTDKHIAELAGSIREFGFNVPVLIDENNNIMAGHGRVLAARKLDMKQVPVVVASHLTDIQRRAFILADNKLHDNSSFDFELLNLELEELKDVGFDLELLGFSSFEFGNNGTTDQSLDVDDMDPPDIDDGLGVGEVRYEVMVYCRNIEEREALVKRLQDEGYICKAVKV